MINYLVHLLFLSVSFGLHGQEVIKTEIETRFQYPIFLKEIDNNDGFSKIIMYNYDEKYTGFKEFDEAIGNFDNNTFYVKKLISYNDDRGLITIEYFRINKNAWREVITKEKGHHYQNLIVLDEIIHRDTFLTFKVDTFEDVYNVIEYQNCK